MSLSQYLKDTQGELKHVSWPPKQTTINFTIAVIVISVVTAIFLGIFDAGFAKGLTFLLGR
jgi:preprotein translocase SecE subunit